MIKPIYIKHPNLWHYTTAAGLVGILRTQELWSTNFRYLNDEEELSGFFQRKFPEILQAGLDEGLKTLSETVEGNDFLLKVGGVEHLKSVTFNMLNESISKVTLKMDLYVTSFSCTNQGQEGDGLLSQWRGYGHDGGYAMVFDTKGLFDLLKKERDDYQHFLLNFSSVDYHYAGWMSNKDRNNEAVVWESAIKDAVANLLVNGNLKDQILALVVPMLSLAMRHKHKGFEEEREVRISVLRFPDQSQPKKSINFYNRSGVLVPYISLFDGSTAKTRSLPVKEIVIGPHPDKLKRKQAVEVLLRELELNIPVRVSDIPYLGR